MTAHTNDISKETTAAEDAPVTATYRIATWKLAVVMGLAALLSVTLTDVGVETRVSGIFAIVAITLLGWLTLRYAWAPLKARKQQQAAEAETRTAS